MKKIKALNLYAGIGGNRKLWTNVDVTAVEINPEIAKIYQDFFPEDKVIVGDAHEYLLQHFKEFDFIWSSPPCPSHGISRYWSSKAEKSKLNYPKPIYPEMNLWQEIIFFKHFFKGKWVVENVVSYYEPLIKPYIYKSHYYWANFVISGSKKVVDRKVWKSQIKPLEDKNGFDLSAYKGIDKLKILRNCVEPDAGLYVFRCAFDIKQITLNDDGGTNFTKSSADDFPMESLISVKRESADSPNSPQTDNTNKEEANFS